MSGYGFRLYTVKLVSGSSKSKAIDFGECGMYRDEHVSVWIRRALELLEGFEPLTGAPLRVMAVDETELPAIQTYVRSPQRGEYKTGFVSHTATPATRIRFTINYARTGKVSVGIEDARTIKLGHIPTGDPYRGLLYLPHEGTRGVLALESVPSAPNPSRMLNAWLARAAVDLAAEDAEYVDALPPEEAKKAKPFPYKLNFNQYPNIARIERAVENAQTAKVVLKRDGIDGGGVAGDEDVLLTSSLKTTKTRRKAAKLAGGLVRKALGKLEESEEPVTIDDLEDLVEGSLDGIEWTEGYIQVEDETGLKKIGLEKIDKFFIYPCHSPTPLSDKKFEQEVAKEVVSLQAVLGVDLDLA